MFKVGDRVRINTNGPYQGKEGVVSGPHVQPDSLMVAFKEGAYSCGFWVRDLEHATPLSPFEQRVLAYIERELSNV